MTWYPVLLTRYYVTVHNQAALAVVWVFVVFKHSWLSCVAHYCIAGHAPAAHTVCKWGVTLACCGSTGTIVTLVYPMHALPMHTFLVHSSGATPVSNVDPAWFGSSTWLQLVIWDCNVCSAEFCLLAESASRCPSQLAVVTVTLQLSSSASDSAVCLLSQHLNPGVYKGRLLSAFRHCLQLSLLSKPLV